MYTLRAIFHLQHPHFLPTFPFHLPCSPHSFPNLPKTSAQHTLGEPKAWRNIRVHAEQWRNSIRTAVETHDTCHFACEPSAPRLQQPGVEHCRSSSGARKQRTALSCSLCHLSSEQHCSKLHAAQAFNRLLRYSITY